MYSRSKSPAKSFERLMAFAVLLSLGLTLAACADKKEKTGSAQEEASSEGGEGSGAGEARKGGMEADEESEGKNKARSQPVDPNSPTGIPLCDNYLEKVCKCAKSHPALKLACENGKKSAPRWKKSSGKDPRSREVVETSCRTALKQIKENFGCR